MTFDEIHKNITIKMANIVWGIMVVLGYLYAIMLVMEILSGDYWRLAWYEWLLLFCCGISVAGAFENYGG